MPELICFTGDNVLVGNTLDLEQNVSLNVENGRIISVGEPIKDAVQVKFESALICPMFINAHCHLGDTGAKEMGVGIPMELLVSAPNGLKHRFLSKLTRDVHISQMRHGLEEMLTNGIIACGDFREQGFEGVLRLREASIGLPIQLKILGRISESASEKQMLEEAYQVLDASDGLGVRDVDCYPTSLLEKLRSIFPGKLFAAHVAENNLAEKESIKKYGFGQAVRSLSWRPDILVHLTHSSQNEMKKLQSSGVRVVSCPRTNSILGDGIPDLKSWIESGIEFGLGTDNMLATSPNMLMEMDYASRLIRGVNQDPGCIDSKTLLMSATINGAKVLKLEGDLGSLSPGKQANFIVFDLESLNLKYTQDLISGLVNRAGVCDIKNIYIEGEKYK